MSNVAVSGIVIYGLPLAAEERTRFLETGLDGATYPSNVLSAPHIIREC